MSNATPRSCGWFYIHSDDICVLQWSKDTEDLQHHPDKAQTERLINAVRRFEFDKGLAPYDADNYGKWIILSSYIAPGVISAVTVSNPKSITRITKTSKQVENQQTSQNEPQGSQMNRDTVLNTDSSLPHRRELPSDRKRRLGRELGEAPTMSFTPIPSSEIPVNAPPELITFLQFENTRKLEEYFIAGEKRYQGKINPVILSVLQSKHLERQLKQQPREKYRQKVETALSGLPCPFMWAIGELQLAFVRIVVEYQRFNVFFYAFLFVFSYILDVNNPPLRLPVHRFLSLLGKNMKVSRTGPIY